MKFMSIVLAGTLALSLNATSLEDLLGDPKDVLEISPVEYKGLPIDGHNADSVCKIAGYRMVESKKTGPIDAGKPLYYASASDLVRFDLRRAEGPISRVGGITSPATSILLSVTCRGKIK